MKYEPLVFGNTQQNFILEIVSVLLAHIDIPICGSGFGSLGEERYSCLAGTRCFWIFCSEEWVKLGNKEISWGRRKEYKAAKRYVKGKPWRRERFGQPPAAE